MIIFYGREEFQLNMAQKVDLVKANVYLPCRYDNLLFKANCNLLRNILNRHLMEEADDCIPILNEAEESDNEDEGKKRKKGSRNNNNNKIMYLKISTALF